MRRPYTVPNKVKIALSHYRALRNSRLGERGGEAEEEKETHNITLYIVVSTIIAANPSLRLQFESQRTTVH